MNTIHFFGDSFSYGDGTRHTIVHNEEDWRQPNPDNNVFWTEFVCKQLDFHEKNHANRGMSNSEIIYQMLKVANTFEPGDIIVVGQSFPQREPFFTRIPDINRDLDWFATRIGSTQQPPPHENHFSDEFKSDILPWHPSDLWVTTQSFIANVKHAKHPYYKAWYDVQVKQLLLLFKKLGVDGLTWIVPDEAGKYENIRTATNGLVDDAHWSWKGNLHFGRAITKRVQRIIKLREKNGI